MRDDTRADTPVRVWGGPQRKRYYGYDGREIWKIPDIRGNEQGDRDANLDRYLERPPKDPWPTCPHCGEWHETQEGIDQCGKRAEKALELGNRLLKKDKDRVAELEKRVKHTDEKLDRILSLLEGK